MIRMILVQRMYIQLKLEKVKRNVCFLVGNFTSTIEFIITGFDSIIKFWYFSALCFARDANVRLLIIIIIIEMHAKERALNGDHRVARKPTCVGVRRRRNERERERESRCIYVCVCVRERERERVCVCVWGREVYFLWRGQYTQWGASRWMGG